MELPTDTPPDGTSPRTFALNHLRPRSSFLGCSRISDYELQGKLGEGTFGYGLSIPGLSLPGLGTTYPTNAV